MKLLIFGNIRQRFAYELTKSDIEYVNIPDFNNVIISVKDKMFYYNETPINVNDFDVIYCQTSAWEYDIILGFVNTRNTLVLGGNSAVHRSGNNKFLSAACVASDPNINIPFQFYSRKELTFENCPLLDTLGDKVVVKPTNSSEGKGIELYTKSPIEKYEVDKIQSGVNRIYEEYIDGGFHDERYIVVNGKITNAMRRTAKDGTFKANLSQGGYGEKYDYDKETEDFVLKIYEHFKGLFLCGIDIMRDQHNKLYFIEINTRPGDNIIYITDNNFYLNVINEIKDCYENFINKEATNN